MTEFGFERKFHDLEYFEFGFLKNYIPWIHYKIEGNLQKFVVKHQFNVISSCSKQNLQNYTFNISTCTLLAPSSKICRSFLRFVFSTNIVGFVDQCVFQMFMIFSFTKLKGSTQFWIAFIWTYARRITKLCTWLWLHHGVQIKHIYVKNYIFQRLRMIQSMSPRFLL